MTDPTPNDPPPLAHDDRQGEIRHTWTVRAAWRGGQETTVYARNQAFTVGPPVSFKASDPHPSAIEYLMGALAADLTNGYQIHAARAGVVVDALEIRLSGQLDNALVFLGVIGETGSPGFHRITGTLYVTADADDMALQHIWQTTLARSPIVNTLRHGVTLTLTLQIIL